VFQSSNDNFINSRKVRTQVLEPFGGLAPGVREVVLFTGAGGGDCGIPFRPGEVYLIDAILWKDGRLHVGACSATARIDYADVALQVLRLRSEGRPVPSLIGRIQKRDRSSVEVLGLRVPGSLAHVRIRVKANGKVYETRADADGIYEFYDLPSGHYEFDPALPPDTTASWYLQRELTPDQLELKAGICHQHDISLFTGGSISGRLLDQAGKPIPHTTVYIVSAGANVLPKASQVYWVSEAKNGMFKFDHVPTGKYWLIVNPEDSLSAGFPYHRTFYPGTTDQNLAGTIELNGGDEIRNADIRLQRKSEPPK